MERVELCTGKELSEGKEGGRLQCHKCACECTYAILG